MINKDDLTKEIRSLAKKIYSKHYAAYLDGINKELGDKSLTKNAVISDYSLDAMVEMFQSINTISVDEAWKMYSKDPNYAMKSYSQFAAENGFRILLPTQSGHDNLFYELEQLRRWKAEAMAVDIVRQKVAQLLGIGLGEPIHEKIIPAIEKLIRDNKMLKQEVTYLDKRLEDLSEP